MFWIYLLILAGIAVGCLLAWWLRREIVVLLPAIAFLILLLLGVLLIRSSFDFRLKVLGVVAIAAVVVAIPLLTVMPFVLKKLNDLIDVIYRGLRNVHGAEATNYQRFWDVAWPIFFLVAFIVLFYSDYTLFAARIASILGIPGASVPSKGVLDFALGALYVVALVVIGLILSDAYGHSPAGQALTTTKLSGIYLTVLKVVLWVGAALTFVATLALAAWTAETQMLGTDGNVSGTIFLISFSVVAFLALLLAAVPMVMGIVAMSVVFARIVYGVFWLASGLCWLALWLFDKLVAGLCAVVNLLARAGAYLCGAQMRKKAPLEWEPRPIVHEYANRFPLVPAAEPTGAVATVPRAALPPPRVSPLEERQGNTEIARDVVVTDGHEGAPVTPPLTAVPVEPDQALKPTSAPVPYMKNVNESAH